MFIKPLNYSPSYYFFPTDSVQGQLASPTHMQQQVSFFSAPSCKLDPNTNFFRSNIQTSSFISSPTYNGQRPSTERAMQNNYNNQSSDIVELKPAKSPKKMDSKLANSGAIHYLSPQPPKMDKVEAYLTGDSQPPERRSRSRSKPDSRVKTENVCKTESSKHTSSSNSFITSFDDKIKEILNRTKVNHERIMRLKNNAQLRSPLNSERKANNSGENSSENPSFIGSPKGSDNRQDQKESGKKEIPKKEIATKEKEEASPMNQLSKTVVASASSLLSSTSSSANNNAPASLRKKKNGKIDELLARIDNIKKKFREELTPAVPEPKNESAKKEEEKDMTKSEVLSPRAVTSNVSNPAQSANSDTTLNSAFSKGFVSREWKIEDFQIGKCLGKGRFGCVYLAKEKKSSFIVAIKMIKKNAFKDNKIYDQIKNEIKIQFFLDHPNMIKLYGFFSDADRMYLIQEYAPGGDLYKSLKAQPNKRFDEKMAANYIKQLCEALIYLHQNDVIHRDIKPENILNCYGVLKLSDFGWAIHAPQGKRQTFCGTLDYVSPEIVGGKTYDQKVDIWSIGVLSYELCTGKPPFEKSTNAETFSSIASVKFTYPSFLSEDLKDFLAKLLVKEPENRVELEEILQHPWIISNTAQVEASHPYKI